MIIEPFSIADFEQCVFKHDHEAALRQLMTVVNLAERGRLPPVRARGEALDHDSSFTNRLAVAIQALLLDPELRLSPAGFHRLVAHHRNLVTLFGASGLGGSGHLPALFGLAVDGETVTLPSTQALCKMLCCCGLDALPEPFVRALPQVDPAIALPAVLALLSQRAVLTPRAERNRRWLLTHADFLDRGTLPDQPIWMARLASAWMLCSYSEEPERHRVKGTLNRVLRRWLGDHGIHDRALPTTRERPERPTVLVIGEHFHSTHVMFRTFAPFIRQLAARFRCVLLVTQGTADSITAQLFDEVVTIDRNRQTVSVYVEAVRRLAPDLIYFPSVGMSHWGVVLANLRLAPIQFMSMGHPASSFSEQMDYIVMGRVKVGDPARYAERVITLDTPRRRREQRHDAVPLAPVIRERPEVLHVAIPCRSIKLTAGFIELCGEFVARSPRRIEMHFFPNETGLLHAMVRQELCTRLPTAVVHPSTGYNEYIANLNRCDMALSTFPFTSSNSAVDTYRQGIPMVVYSGVEAQERSDLRMLRTVNAPEWLVSTTRERYLENALRLAADDDLRVAISRQLLATDIDGLIFAKERDPHPTLFVDTVDWLFRHHEAIQATDRMLWTAEDRRALAGR